MRQKLLSFIISTFGLFYLVDAQNTAPVGIRYNAYFQTTSVIDTVLPASFGSPCDTVRYKYVWDRKAPVDTGYVFGNNKYGTLECAQRYKNLSGTLSEVLVVYTNKAGTNGNTIARIYSVNATTKAPSATLASSGIIKTGSIAAISLTSYTFSPAIPITDEIYAGVGFPTSAGDTVAVLSTQGGCNSGDSLAWVFIQGQWFSIARYLTNGKAFNLDFAILPVLSVGSGINELSSGDIKILNSYPNPAKTIATITYHLKQPSSNVSVIVFDLNGRTVYSNTQSQSAGRHELILDVNNLAAGSYYYTIQTETSALTSKFSVVK